MPSLSEKLHDLVERSGLAGAVTVSQSFDDENSLALSVLDAVQTLAVAAKWPAGGDLAALVGAVLETPEASRLAVYLDGFAPDSD